MAHDILKDSVEAQTFRASVYIVGILLGGVLVLSSYVVPWLPVFAGAVGGEQANFHADVLALAGALLLGVPIILHSLREMLHGHMHMEELVALAIIAALTASPPDFRLGGGRIRPPSAGAPVRFRRSRWGFHAGSW